jgi:hypothetical protein
MQNLGVPGQRIFWCARCGTVKNESCDGGHEQIDRPILVTRLRSFEADKINMAGIYWRDAWHLAGIAESINLPEARP